MLAGVTGWEGRWNVVKVVKVVVGLVGVRLVLLLPDHGDHVGPVELRRR